MLEGQNLLITFDITRIVIFLLNNYNMQVGSVNFSSSFEPQADSPPAECTHFYSNLASIVCREDVLCADTTTQSKVSVIHND